MADMAEMLISPGYAHMEMNSVDMFSQIDLEITIKELEHNEACEHIHELVDDQGDDDGFIRFNELWTSTVDIERGSVPRVVNPFTESRGEAIHKHITGFSKKGTCAAALQLGLPLLLCFNGKFSSSGPFQHCGCNHCETCFHNNVLSLRTLMFGQKNDGVSDETFRSS